MLYLNLPKGIGGVSNRHKGGIIVYVREDISWKILTKFTPINREIIL